MLALAPVHRRAMKEIQNLPCEPRKILLRISPGILEIFLPVHGVRLPKEKKNLSIVVAVCELSVTLSFVFLPILQNRLKANQKEKVKKFIQVTNTGEQTAIYCLNSSEWKFEMAVDNYYQNPDHFYREQDKRKVESLFNRYRDPGDNDKIGADGVVRFLKELGLPAESRLVLIIAWKFKAETQCEFTREEFYRGFQELGVDTLERLKDKLGALDAELKDNNKFKDFYQFTFNYAKDPGTFSFVNASLLLQVLRFTLSAAGQKGLDLEMAIAYWRICMHGRFKFLDDWCRFLTVSHSFLIWKLSDFLLLFTYRKTINDLSQKTHGICYLILPSTLMIK